jgi:hypothetical protein
MLEAVKRMPEVVTLLRLERFGTDVGCRGGIATRQGWPSFRFIDDECKARDIKVRREC